MKELIRFEEVAMFGLGVFLFSLLNYSWWWFVGLLFVPDISMLGYLINDKMGAWSYNVFHHKAVAVLVVILGWFSEIDIAVLVGLVFFSHASFDRIFGYGLKYEKGFKFTHLGEIGEKS